MRRWYLSKRDRRKLAGRVREQFGGRRVEKLVELLTEGNTEVVVEDDIELYLVDGKPVLVNVNNVLVPHLLFLLSNGYDWLPYIVVDKGAVGPISRGADLMRPGVTSFVGDYDKDDIVVIVEPTRRLPLAVHRALLSRKEAEKLEKGRITKSLHHVGDKFWKFVNEKL